MISDALDRSISERKNSEFSQVYDLGWQRILSLSKGEISLRLYVFLAKNLDPGQGAVLCDQQFLADELDVSVRTVQRGLKKLEDSGALIRIPVAGRVCAYALDPDEVWRGYNNGKRYASFNTKTLTSKSGDIRKKLQARLSAREKHNAM